MREFARAGHDCLVITSDSNQLADVPKLQERRKLERIDGVQFCWVRTLKYGAAKSLRRILSWLDFEWQLWRLPKQDFPSPDAVIVSSLSLLTILNGLLLRVRHRCRLIFEVRDIWPLTLTEEGGLSRWNPFVLMLGLVERVGYRLADEVVGTMPNLGEHVAGVLGYPKKVHCIPMGVDRQTLPPGEDSAGNPLAALVPRGKFIVAHVGAMGISNALDTFMACAEAMRDEPGVHFVTVGNGDLRASYESRFGRLPNLTFAPKVSKKDVPGVLAACDLLYFSAHPSKVWLYGQSLNKLVDYMLAGKPIVASYTGYPSMINEAACGTFVPAGDAEALRQEIIRFARMPKREREICGRRGREWILKHRGYDKLAGGYMDIIFPAPPPPAGG
jgi:glycosyltransferase involved in cell wall biosynthesis